MEGVFQRLVSRVDSDSECPEDEFKAYSYCHIIPLLAKNEKFLALFKEGVNRIPIMLANYYIRQELDLLQESLVTDSYSKEEVQFYLNATSSSKQHLPTIRAHLLGPESGSRKSPWGCKSGLCCRSNAPHMVELRTRIAGVYEANRKRAKAEMEALETEIMKLQKQKEERLRKRMCHCALTLSQFEPFLRHLRNEKDERPPKKLREGDSNEFNDELYNGYNSEDSDSEDQELDDTALDLEDGIPESRTCWVTRAGELVLSVQEEYSSTSSSSYFCDSSSWTEYKALGLQCDASDFETKDTPGKLFGDLLFHLFGLVRRDREVLQYLRGSVSEPDKACKTCSEIPSVQRMMSLINEAFEDGTICNDEHFQRPLDFLEEKEAREIRNRCYDYLFFDLRHEDPGENRPLFEQSFTNNTLQNYEKKHRDGGSKYPTPADTLADIEVWIAKAGGFLAEELKTVSTSGVVISPHEEFWDDSEFYNWTTTTSLPIALRGTCLKMLWDHREAPHTLFLKEFAKFLFAPHPSKEGSVPADRQIGFKCEFDGTITKDKYEEIGVLARKWSVLINENLEYCKTLKLQHQKIIHRIDNLTDEPQKGGNDRPNKKRKRI
ncbi:hypothetical protein BJ508DRAFT_310084 [Ascobolus immersus RN42]|uniref:Uncharacterized protein n=1 Tax=Ascobolus immersus RN42 TaxID=1160509 RepID=A0A3N4HYB7_ASCIM|nr:hypothetical protein BJ508DRAFT_310084 [Ascobolus immersus RN42]